MINRHNYEEIFLLYVDNELDLDGKTAVEDFVKQNPDLAQELELLQQATLADDTFPFTEKELLFKKETGISLINYEEYFLLAADNELNQQQIDEVESFVLKHPQLQSEFTLLQNMKIKPEQISFPGKQVLYRREGRERSIPVFWMRMSAAAALFGVIITTVVFTSQRDTNNNNTVSVNSNNSANAIVEKAKPLAQIPVIAKQSHTSDIVKVEKDGSKDALVVAPAPKKVNKVKSKKTKNVEEQLVVNKQENNIKPKAALEVAEVPTVEATIDESKVAAPQKIKPLDTKPHRGIIDNDSSNDMRNSFAKQNSLDEQPVLASHAVYIETDQDEEEKTLYIGSAEINKNKLKGLFKKAAVFFDKKIRRNDN